jgi:hypothetical protein
VRALRRSSSEMASSERRFLEGATRDEVVLLLVVAVEGPASAAVCPNTVCLNAGFGTLAVLDSGASTSSSTEFAELRCLLRQRTEGLTTLGLAFATPRTRLVSCFITF